jgi:outer membrane protein OmpA-like peptidoglycan-associated protein
MRNRKAFMLYMAVLGFLFATSSCNVLNQANNHFEYSEYSSAIPLYKKALKIDSSLTDVWAKLGDCYRFINETREAEACYERVVKDTASSNIYKLFYVQMLINNTKYDEAEEWIEKYRQAAPNDSRGSNLQAGIRNIENFLSDKELYQVQKINVNSDESDYGPVFFKEGLLFNSSRKSESWANRQDSWTGKRFFSVYFAKGEKATFGDPEIFMKGMQTKYNNSSVCFNSEGNEMYMTRNNIENGVERKSKNQTVNLKIYGSKLVDGIWGEAIPFEYNNDNYSCAHPAINKDGTKIIFSSDMPGSYGGMDLWTCTRTANGWSKPVNMGVNVNTEGNEVFPTISDNGIIYFSSNGYGGLGGMDIYLTADSTDSYSKPKNAGFPINSPDDDFGLIWDSQKGIGYFTSNRINQGYNDDIFVLTRSAKFVVNLFDSKTNKRIAPAKVVVIEEGGVPESSQIGKKGNLKKGLSSDKNYMVVIDHERYRNDTIRISGEDLKANPDGYVVDFKVEKEPLILTISGVALEGSSKTPADSIEVKLVNLTSQDTLTATTGPDGNYSFEKIDGDQQYRFIATGNTCISGIIDTTFQDLVNDQTVHIDVPLFCLTQKNHISTIYYDLDKSDIRSDAALVLDQLALLMEIHPGIEVELASFTDHPATTSYNLKLSERRAKAAVQYLAKKGISKKRLTGKGYGEAKDPNTDKVSMDPNPLNEQENQFFRRTEIIVVSKDWTAVSK